MARAAGDARSVQRLGEIADYIVPFTLRAICDLGVADHLVDGARPVEELARLTGAHPPTLQRALRALAAKGVFTEVAPGVFDLTPLAQPLRSDHPQSLREAYPLLAPEIRAWAVFDHTLRTGEASFDHAHGGQRYWDYMAEHPTESARFDASQRAVSRRELRALLSAYEWDRLASVVDVGGGNGAFLAGLLAEYPALCAVLYDQPHVVSTARAVLTEAGVADRCQVIGGSFLDSVPAGADAYVMKRVLYAWNDGDATTILRAVRVGMHEDSRLLIVEPLVVPGDAFEVGKLYDLLLVAMSGGGARTREEMDAVLEKADLEITRVIPTRMLPIIEARPV
jgi:hypothetical protein